MTESQGISVFHSRARADWVRLRTLVLLRWTAIAGQALAILIAAKFLGFQLPLGLCALLISVSVAVNMATTLINPSETRLSERGTQMSLLFDLVQLVTLLILTGGLNNPFAVLVVAPVTVSASALRLRSTLILGSAALVSLPLMYFFYVPLITANSTVLEAPEIYRTGISIALATGIVFLSLYARRVTVEGYRMSEALSATQLVLAREQRLAAIGGIAAATAHELGTPLATIKLVAGELAYELEDNAELAADVALIRQQADRCGEILADLSRSGKEDAQMKQAPVSTVLEEAAGPHAKRGKEIVLRFAGLTLEDAPEDMPSVLRSPELLHGLRNLIQNAVDFAQTTVWIDIEREEDTLRVTIGDDGPGFSADVLPRLGEPYVSTRHRGRRKKPAEGYEGMGLGLFIARTLLERTGATLSFANGGDALRRRTGPPVPTEIARPPGAIFEVTWPAEALIRHRSASLDAARAAELAGVENL